MKYYTVQDSTIYAKFAIEEVAETKMALCQFDDSSAPDILRIIAEHNAEIEKERPNDYCYQVIGDDGYGYAFRLSDGDKIRMGRFSLKKLHKAFNQEKAYGKYLAQCKKELAKYSIDTILDERKLGDKCKENSNTNIKSENANRKNSENSKKELAKYSIDTILDERKLNNKGKKNSNTNINSENANRKNGENSKKVLAKRSTDITEGNIVDENGNKEMAKHRVDIILDDKADEKGEKEAIKNSADTMLGSKSDKNGKNIRKTKKIKSDKGLTQCNEESATHGVNTMLDDKSEKIDDVKDGVDSISAARSGENGERRIKGRRSRDGKYCRSKYRKYNFVSVTRQCVVPFRYKRAKGKKPAPLVVYYHSGGCMGYENMLQLWEFRLNEIKLLGKKCNILLPQAAQRFNQAREGIDRYVAVVKDIIDRLIQTSNIDATRIYLVGTSFGGACVWSSLYNYPNYFAAGIPVMGGLLNERKSECDVQRLRNENIWMAHSADDTNVIIKYDDNVFEQLKAQNIGVKYTRWNKFGHSMHIPFYLFCGWAKWLFKQKKNS